MNNYNRLGYINTLKTWYIMYFYSDQEINAWNSFQVCQVIKE